MSARRKGPIELATRRSIDPILLKGGMAAAALDLAHTLDEQELSASAQASVARELRLALAELARLDTRVIPDKAREAAVKDDPVDDLKARRAAREAARRDS